MQLWLVLVTAGCSLLVCSCTLLQTPIAMAPVGPGPSNQTAQATTGYLKVYSNVQGFPYDADNFYYVHSDYNIYDSNGRHVKNVQNTELYQSLTPREVALPPGHYEVVAWGDGFQKMVKVPVEIKTGCLTIVNLEIDNHELFQNAKPDDLVHASDGRIVGWAATASAR